MTPPVDPTPKRPRELADPAQPGPTASAADVPAVRLPTLPLLAGAVLPPLVVGAAWALLAGVAGRPDPVPIGLSAGGVVAAAGACSVLLLGPWKRRSLSVLPFLWIAASGARFVLTIGGGLLLYSRPALERPDFWFAIALAYVAVLAAETRLYAASIASGHRSSVPSGDPPDDTDARASAAPKSGAAREIGSDRPDGD